ncbi:MAG: ATP-binding protein [Gammaproteobacteria bacterium]|jgi:hypothetical protein
MSTADITIHLDSEPQGALRADIESRVASLDGVTEVSFSEKARHLMVVHFDSHKLHTDRILEAVRRTGVGAELIGL